MRGIGRQPPTQLVGRWSRRRSSDQPSVSARTDVRQKLPGSRPPVSSLSAAIPYATSRRTAVPGSVTLVSRVDVVPCKAATDLAKGAHRFKPCRAHQLLQVRIEDCEPPRLLRAQVYVDLVGLPPRAGEGALAERGKARSTQATNRGGRDRERRPSGRACSPRTRLLRSDGSKWASPSVVMSP